MPLTAIYRTKNLPLIAALLVMFVIAGQAVASHSPYGYGFLGGDFFPDEDSSLSTWNDIHFACHFTDAEDLQAAIDEIDPENQVLIDLGRAWQARIPSCDLEGPWGDVSLFISRVEPLLSTLNANQERLLALWIFDEPDAAHGGPTDTDLQAAVDYLHEQVPEVPVFVNWFAPENNPRIPNADWYATTQGGDPSALSGFGKPMFLWWFNNEADPNPAVVNKNWQDMVSYYYRTNPPVITSLGWCCDSLENFNDNDNSTELDALLANLGRLRRDTGTVSRAPYAHRQDGSWYLFRREPDGTLSYTDDATFPDYNPFPIGGSSPFYPAISTKLGVGGTWIRILRAGEDNGIYLAWIAPDDTWIDWVMLPGQTDAKPDVLRFRAVTWQAIRGTDGAVYVLRANLDADWVSLGGEATSAPFFKVVEGRLRVAVFWPDGQVYSREWNGIGWNPWMVEP